MQADKAITRPRVFLQKRIPGRALLPGREMTEAFQVLTDLVQPTQGIKAVPDFGISRGVD